MHILRKIISRYSFHEKGLENRRTAGVLAILPIRQKPLPVVIFMKNPDHDL